MKNKCHIKNSSLYNKKLLEKSYFYYHNIKNDNPKYMCTQLLPYVMKNFIHLPSKHHHPFYDLHTKQITNIESSNFVGSVASKSSGTFLIITLWGLGWDNLLKIKKKYIKKLFHIQLHFQRINFLTVLLFLKFM